MCINIRYPVTLTSDERHELQALTSGGEGQSVASSGPKFSSPLTPTPRRDDCTRRGCRHVDRLPDQATFVEDGLNRALTEMSRPGAPRKLGASDEALLVAVACSRPPSGRAQWTLDLLAGQVVRLTTHETVSGAFRT